MDELGQRVHSLDHVAVGDEHLDSWQSAGAIKAVQATVANVQLGQLDQSVAQVAQRTQHAAAKVKGLEARQEKRQSGQADRVGDHAQAHGFHRFQVSALRHPPLKRSHMINLIIKCCQKRYFVIVSDPVSLHTPQLLRALLQLLVGNNLIYYFFVLNQAF